MKKQIVQKKKMKTISFKEVFDEINGSSLDNIGREAILKDYRRIHAMMCELTNVPTKPIYEKDKEELKVILETLFKQLNSVEGAAIKSKIRAYNKEKEQGEITLKSYFTYDEYEQLLSYFAEAYEKLNIDHIHKQNIEQLNYEEEVDQRILQIMQQDAELRWSLMNVEKSVELAKEYEQLLLESPQFQAWRKKTQELIQVEVFTNHLIQRIKERE